MWNMDYDLFVSCKFESVVISIIELSLIYIGHKTIIRIIELQIHIFGALLMNIYV